MPKGVYTRATRKLHPQAKLRLKAALAEIHHPYREWETRYCLTNAERKKLGMAVETEKVEAERVDEKAAVSEAAIEPSPFLALLAEGDKEVSLVPPPAPPPSPEPPSPEPLPTLPSGDDPFNFLF